MNGSIGPRFSFTHYPQAGKAIGPGATLVRPIPDPSAPCVMFLGMVALGGGGGSGEGSGIGDGSATSGPGFAFGTLGPILGEVGTTTARVLVEVRWLDSCLLARSLCLLISERVVLLDGHLMDRPIVGKG